MEAFDDEAVPGVSCYVSRAKTGGLSGAVGVAEDSSDASIDCRQIGPVRLPDEVRSGKADGEEVFKRRTSLLFKSLQVVRFYDPRRNALVYLTYSDRIIEGSPKNSISAVPSCPGRVLSRAQRPTNSCFRSLDRIPVHECHASHAGLDQHPGAPGDIARRRDGQRRDPRRVRRPDAGGLPLPQPFHRRALREPVPGTDPAARRSSGS